MEYYHESPITSVDLSKEGSFVATGGVDKIVKLWDSVTGNMLKKFEGHEGEISSVKLSSQSLKGVD